VSPLEIEALKKFNDIRLIIYFTLATFVATSIIFYINPVLFRKYYNADNWNVGKFILDMLLIITIVAFFNTMIMYYFRTKQDLGILSPLWLRFLFWYTATFIVGFVPCVLAFLIPKYNSFQKEMAFVPEVNQMLDAYNIRNDDESVVLTGGVKEKLEICPDNFLYAEVSANYVKTYVLKGNKCSEVVLRTTLYKLLESFKDYPQIVRCHRAFIVNTSKITQIKGNSQAYQLDVYNLNINIPVSRTYTRIIKEKVGI